MKLVRRGLVAVAGVAAAAVVGFAALNAIESTTPDDPDPTWHATSPGDRSAGDTTAERLTEEYELVDLAGPDRTQVRRRADLAVVATLTAGAEQPSSPVRAACSRSRRRPPRWSNR